jgi:cytochrome c oxidase cbb3-type subunit I/II
LGVPYEAGYEHQANADLKEQAEAIAADLKQGNVRVQSDREIIAIIAYIQRLGRDIRTK